MIVELSKRRVFRVISGYAVVCFVILQIADVAFEPLGISDDTLRLIIAGMLLALPLVGYLSWIFDVDIGSALTRTKSARPWLEASIAVVALSVFAVGAWFVVRSPSTVSDSDKSSPAAMVGDAESVEEPGTNVGDNRTAIAVLPFNNLSNDPEQEYFSDGLAEDILNELAKNQQLIVRPRSSSFALKGTDLDLKAISQRLNVTHVLEGSVRRSSGRLRITAQLSEVASDRSIWSERYERELTDVFAVQDDVVAKILSSLNVQLSAPVSSRQFGIEAYDAFLLGRDHFFRSQFEQASKWYEKAVELDPSYTQAWAAQAQILAWATAGGFKSNSGVHLAKRREFIKAALKLDSSNATALAIRALQDTFYVDQEYELAVNDLIRLVTTNPNDEAAHHALGLVLGAIGRLDLQTRVANRLAELSPESFAAQSPRIHALIETGALEEARQAVQDYETRFDYPLVVLNFALATGDVSRLQRALERAPERWSTFAPVYLALVPYLKEDYEQAREIVAPFKGIGRYTPHVLRSYIALIERDVDTAFKYHYTAMDEAEPNAIAFIRGLPGFRRVFPEFYDHPRHAQMLEDYGLDAESVAKMEFMELPF